MFRRIFCYQFHGKTNSKSFQIQMFDQGWSVKRSITDETFESYAGENV